MLTVEAFTFNPFSENSYVIINNKKQCWFVDPGMCDAEENKAMNSFIIDNQLSPQGVINTHAHIDHILGVQMLMDKYKIPFGMHETELPVLNMAKASAAMFGVNITAVPVPTYFIKEGQPLKLGDDTLQVFYTPGHSPGSISFYYAEGNWVLAGDVLFQGSIGRTDLPGGDFNTLIKSIRTHLLTLPDNTIVLSGHGDATTIGDEKRYNPFLK